MKIGPPLITKCCYLALGGPVIMTAVYLQMTFTTPLSRPLVL